MNSESTPTLGQALACEREKKNTPLEEISRRTNIKIKSLQALERDDYNLIPGDFYLRSYTKSYLKAIGSDETSFFETYRDVLNISRIPTKEKKGTYYSKLRYARFKKKSVLFSVIIVLIVFMLSFVGLYIGKHNVIGTASILPEMPTTWIPLPTTISEFNIDYWPVRVEIEFKNDCWMQVHRGQNSVHKKTLEQVFQKGDKIKLNGYSLHFFIGNPSALKFYLNSRELTSLQNMSKAERLNITPGTIKDL